MRRFTGHGPKVLGVCTALLALLIAPATRADDQHVFWEIAGQHNTVYLMGSVHVLSAKDRALPEVSEGAYRNAEVLVEELDLYSMAADLLTPEVMAQTMLPSGQNLATVLGAELNGKLAAAAKPLGIDLEFTSHMQPWYVASLVSSLRLMKAGYTPQDGVDFQLADRAHRDGKPIVGLETTAQQLGFLASLPMDQQRQFLEATLTDADSPEELRQVTEAWKKGDLIALESLLKEGMDESPELFDKLVIQRNRNWLPRIEQMLADPGKDYLVVTGALHMIGSQGLVEQLRAKGYKVTRK